MSALSPFFNPPCLNSSNKSQIKRVFNLRVSSNGFPSFLPKEIEQIKDPFARNLAVRIERLSVQSTVSEASIMSSCVRPLIQANTDPVVLLHGFDRQYFHKTYWFVGSKSL